MQKLNAKIKSRLVLFFNDYVDFDTFNALSANNFYFEISDFLPRKNLENRINTGFVAPQN